MFKGAILAKFTMLAQYKDVFFTYQNFRIRAKNQFSLCFLFVCTCLLGQKFQDMREDCLCFVVFTCSYLLTWPRISGLALKINVVCGFYLLILAYLLACLLAYLAPNFSTCTQFQCGLWFFTFPYLLTCPRNPKFQDLCEKSV